MLMTTNDLRQFKAIVAHLEAKQSIHTTFINTVAAPTPDETHGGPVFMSVGQVIELDVVGEELSNSENSSTGGSTASSGTEETGDRRMLDDEAPASTEPTDTSA